MRSGRRSHLSIALTFLLLSVGAIVPASISATDPPVPVEQDAGDDVTTYPALDNVPPVDETAAGSESQTGITKEPIGVSPAGRVSNLGPTTAAADAIVVQDGETQPVFSYAAAIRERVWVPVPGVDQNSDGVADRVALDIIRPAETNAGLKVPAIIDVSPYYTSVGRGNETEFLHSASATQADKYPLFYDNYFVPRGYAFIAAQAVGTGWSTGCPLHGGPGDVAGFKAAIDWLRGRLPAYNSPTTSDDRRHRRLEQRQERDVRQVIRRNVRERRRRHRRRGLDHDRADLGDLGVVRLLPLERDPPESGGHALPGEPLEHDHVEHVADQSRRRTTVQQRLVRRVADRHERGRRRRRREHQSVLGRPQLQQRRRQREGLGLRLARPQRRQRQDRPVRRVVGRPGCAQRPAQDLARPGRPRRSVRLPSRRLGRHHPPLVRLLAAGHRQRDHERAAGDDRDGTERLRGPGGLAAARTRRTRTSSCAAGRRRRSRATLP